MADFDVAHRFTAKWEGGISDDKADLGGFTAYGVSMAFMDSLRKTRKGAAFLAEIGLRGYVDRELMRRIRPQHAAKIFRYYFWEPLNCEMYNQAVATVYYDCAVNHGRGGGTRLMQKALNKGRKDGMLAVDGIFGPKTFAALRLAGMDDAVRAIDLRRDYYRSIVKNNPAQKRFLKGWLNRADSLDEYLQTLPA